MANLIVRDRTLIQGVSQQPEDLRRAGQVTECVNSWPSPVEGLGKRQGTRHLAKLSDNPYTDALIYGIDRDGAEKYGVLVSHETLVVSDELGTTQQIISGGNLLGRIEEAKDFLNPLRWSPPASTAAALPRHKADDHTDPDGGMSADLLSWETALATNYQTISIADELFRAFAPYLVRLAMKRKDATSNVYILWTDGAGSPNYVDVNLVTGTIVADTGAVPARTKLTALPDGWYQLEILFTHGLVTPATFTTISVYPSAAFGAGPGPAPATVGSGGTWFHKLEIIDIGAPDLSYLSIEKPHLLTDSKDFDIATWTRTNSATLVPPGPVGPYGYDNYTDVQKSTGGTLGTLTQLKGIFSAGPQLLSCFFRQNTTAIGAEGHRLRFRDTTGATIDHDVRFQWSGSGVLEFLSKTNDILDYGVVDHGHGNYQAWISLDTNHTLTATAAGRIRSVAIGVDDADSGLNRYGYAWGAMLVEGVRHISEAPFMDPRQSLDAVTVQDSTFISNAEIVPAMTTSKAAGDDTDMEAFVFVQQAAYGTQYKVSVQFGDTNVVEYAQLVDVEDTTDQPHDTHHIEITNTGVGAGWQATVEGFVATFSTKPTASRTAASAAVHINQVMRANNKLVSATSFGNIVSVRSTTKLVNIAVAVTGMPPGGTSTVTNPIVGTTGAANILRADTSLIAEALAGQINATAGIEAEAKNSVIRLKITDGQPITRLEVEDAVGNTYMRSIWRSVAFFDELPTTCVDGYKINVAGDPEAGEDDYYVVFDADTQGEFGPGVWRETVQTGVLDEFNGATLPHQLSRRQDNSVGTWTGVPNRVFFTWSPVDWSKQRVGSSSLNPPPSFIGRSITGMMYVQSRLGFIANENVILSESSRFENFWRTTVRTLLDSDPIDIAAGTKDVTSFNHVAITDQRTFLFSELSVFELLGSPLTPKTAELRSRLRERNSTRCTPAALGRSVLFTYQNSQFTKVKEIVQVGDDVFDTTTLSAVVPKFIPGKPLFISTSSVEDVVVLMSDGDRSTMYVYKFFQEGDRRTQSSWGTWTFGTKTRILGAVFLQSQLLFYLERDGGVFLESMDLGDGITDRDSQIATRLDRKVESSHPEVTAVFAAGNTTFTLPYVLDASQVQQAWTAPGDSAGEGMRVPGTTTPTTTTIVLTGDYTARKLVFGQQYRQTVTLSKPLRKDQGPDQAAVYLDGRVIALRAEVAFEGAARFQIQVLPGDRTVQTTTMLDGENLGSGLNLKSGSFDVSVREDARDTTIKLLNDQATPANFLSVEYIVEHTPRA